MNVVKKWKRFLALGCSHGQMADPDALKAILKFKESWKPDFTAHLGDAIDTAAFRAGAKGSKDEAEPVDPDVFAGLDFLRKLRLNLYLLGNHEDRLTNLSTHHNAIVACLASKILAEINDECKKMKTLILPYDYRQCYRLANYSLMHGTIFTENAARDHAEVHGNVIHAHNHRAMMATGRRSDAPVGIAVGCLIDPSKAGYAKNRKSTYAWSQGFVWGEYSDATLVPWLHVQPQGVKEWRLPV